MGLMEENYPSKYISAATFEDGAKTLTITAAYRAEVGMEGKKEMKPHIEFAELDKIWTVNKTNLGTLCDAFGMEKFADWIGHTIQLSKGWGQHGFGQPDGPVVALTIPEQGKPAPLPVPEAGTEPLPGEADGGGEQVTVTADDVGEMPF